MTRLPESEMPAKLKALERAAEAARLAWNRHADPDTPAHDALVSWIAARDEFASACDHDVILALLAASRRGGEDTALMREALAAARQAILTAVYEEGGLDGREGGHALTLIDAAARALDRRTPPMPDPETPASAPAATPVNHPTATTMSIYDEIADERAKQDAQWGGPEHDDQHSTSDWREYRTKFERHASRMYTDEHNRAALVKIAALAVAQIESMDRRAALTEPTP